MGVMTALVFTSDDLSGNAAKLVEFFDCGSESGVPVTRFSIAAPGYEVLEFDVQEGKYKTALFLLYLSTLSIGYVERNRFMMNAMSRDLVRAYFGNAICDDALRNPETKHTSVRMLFRDAAQVTVIPEPNH